MTRHPQVKSNRRDYRDGHFHPRWVCREAGCHASGETDPDTPDAWLVLLERYEAHYATEHEGTP